MLSLRVHSALSSTLTEIDVEFDPEDGLDTFFYQLLSIVGGDFDTSNLVLLDEFGREIESVQDILEISYQKAPASSPEDGKLDGQSAATVWCFVRSQLTLDRFCSSGVPNVPVGVPGYAEDLAGAIQPVFSVVDMPFQLCARCAKFLDPSLLQAGAVNAPDQLQCFQCDIGKLIEFGIAPPAAEETLRAEKANIQSLIGERNPAPVTLYLRRRLLDAALAQIQPGATRLHTSREYQQLRSRVESTARSVMVYEDPQQQEVARQHIDYAKVYQYAQEHLGQTATAASTSSDKEVAQKEVRRLEEAALLVGLMRWFKVDFFKWCNKPRCEDPACDAPPHKMDALGGGEPTPEEKNVGWAGRVELYKCQDCRRVTRFARFNNPSHLMLTRRGRCGEFANAFCLILRSLHLDARYVLDFTDHVWCEVWLPSLQRFVHCDPCERALDTPLMYESGWNKKLTHVFSFSRYGVVDASARYSRKQNTVIMRRTMEIVNESVVAEVIAAKDRELDGAFAMRPRRAAGSAECLPWDQADDSDTGAEARATTSALQMLGGGRAAVQALCGRDVAWAQVQQRKRLQQRELLALRLSTDLSNSALCTQGRISGDQEWKLARGEITPGLPVPPPSNATTAVQKPVTSPGVSTPILPAWMSGISAGNSLQLPAGSSLLLAPYGNPLCEQVLGAGASHDRKSVCHGWSSPQLPACTGEALLSIPGAAAPVKLNSSALKVVLGAEGTSGHSATAWTGSVRRSRNGATEEKACPEYVSLSLPARGETSDMPTHAAESLHAVEGHCCAVPCEVLCPEGADNSLAQADSAARARCLQEAQLLGYTLVFANADPASGEVVHVLFFSGAGYPLVPMAGARTFVKVEERQAPRQETPCVESGCMSEALDSLPGSTEGGVPDQAKDTASSDTAGTGAGGMADTGYFFLGGASHGDTSPFDTTTFLRDIPGASAMRLRKLVLWAGSNLVNGVQCGFESSTDTALVLSPACTSDHDRPVRHELVLEAGDRVVAVQCRSGALVDSLEVVTAAGRVLRVGGSGGGDVCKVEIPEGMELCGFFGGTGGHLHNLGVVLRKTPLVSAATAVEKLAAAAQQLRARLLALCEEKGVHPCGLLGYYSGQSTQSLARENSVARFVDLLCAVRAENTQAAAESCIRIIVTYLRNILKNVTERKYQTIKLSNAVLRQQVLACKGGLSLLCFGPGAFRLCSEGGALVLRSGVASEILEADRSAGFRRLYESWLLLYVNALEAAAAQFAAFGGSA